MISVVIPAYNEEHVISSCIEALQTGIVSGEIEVIVVCNGCKDSTAEMVRQFGGVKCLETEIASKANALNMGDHAASYFPRFYLDADVVLQSEDLMKVADTLEFGEYLAASPTMQMDFRNASWYVKAFYDIWSGLPYCQAGMIGAGVYGLSREGRNRFEKFPEIIADDRFIRAIFKESERIGVKGAFSKVTAPSYLFDLIKIKTRSRLGGYQFERLYPELLDNEDKAYGSVARNAIVDIKRWPKYAIYLTVNLIARFRANMQFKRNLVTVWERDESSRNS